MSIVDTTMRLKEWLEKEIAPDSWLKVPSGSGMVGSRYEYKLANPKVFAFFMPTQDLARDQEKVIPSIVIQPQNGEDQPGRRTMTVQLQINTWDPALHASDWYLPNLSEVGAQAPWDKPPWNGEKDKYFELSSEGWMDAWNLTDKILREIENAEYLNGVRILKEEGITWGPAADMDSVVNLYPHWVSWIEFTVDEELQRTKPQDLYKNLL